MDQETRHKLEALMVDLAVSRLDAERLAHAGASDGKEIGWTHSQLASSLSELVITTMVRLSHVIGHSEESAWAAAEDIRSELRKINEANEAHYRRTIAAKAMGS